jgi:subtilisin family serine protease
VLVATPARAGAEASAPNDPGFAKQWGLGLVGVPQAWATATGRGITIAVVDTGVDLHHEDLVANLAPGINLINRSQAPDDDSGHGTHVAGIAAATTSNGKGIAGMAPDARIMPVKALDSHGTGSAEAITQGIEWAVDHGAQIINLSLGAELQGVFGPSFGVAIEYAWAKGAICVVAAGNSFLLSSGFTNQHAVVVGAVGPEDQKPLYASTVGPAMWGLSAPGGMADGNGSDDILSTYPGNQYAYMAGTSMAAPYVSGALAILRSSGLSAGQAIDRLLTTATSLGDPYTFGRGRLDVAKAVSVSAPGGATVSAMGSAVGTGPGHAASPVPVAPAAVGRSAPPKGPDARLASDGLRPHGGPRRLPALPAAAAAAALLAVATATWLVPRRQPVRP